MFFFFANTGTVGAGTGGRRNWLEPNRTVGFGGWVGGMLFFDLGWAMCVAQRSIKRHACLPLGGLGAEKMRSDKLVN